MFGSTTLEALLKVIVNIGNDDAGHGTCDSGPGEGCNKIVITAHSSNIHSFL
jgi:hypothetical protein